MGVTDLNASLPYWATQGGPAGSGGPPGGAQMPGGQDWLQYLAQMYPDQGQGAGPPQQPGALQGAFDNIRNGLSSGLFSRANAASPNIQASLTANPGGIPGARLRPPNQMDLAPGTQSSASLGSYNNMPFPGQQDAAGVFGPRGPGPGQMGPFLPPGGLPSANAPSPAAQTVSSPAAPGALAGGAASANRGAPMGGGPRFITDTAPNSDPLGRNRPQMGMLDLSGLFNRGQPQGAPPQTPRVPGPMATGVSQTTGQPMPMSSADVAYGLPDARGAPYPYAFGPPRRAAALASAGLHSGYA